MEDIVDVYKRSYDEAYPVVCMDETNKAHHKEVRAPIEAKPGKVKREDAEYERNGTSNIFLSVEPLAGKRRVKVTKQRKKIDWAHFIKELVDKTYVRAKKIICINLHLILQIMSESKRNIVS